MRNENTGRAIYYHLYTLEEALFRGLANSIWGLLYNSFLKSRERHQCLTKWQAFDPYAQSFLSFLNTMYWRHIGKELGKSPAIKSSVSDCAVNKQCALMQKEILRQQIWGIFSLCTADCPKGRYTDVYQSSVTCVLTTQPDMVRDNFRNGKRLSITPLFMQAFSDT